MQLTCPLSEVLPPTDSRQRGVSRRTLEGGAPGGSGVIERPSWTLTLASQASSILVAFKHAHVLFLCGSFTGFLLPDVSPASTHLNRVSSRLLSTASSSGSLSAPAGARASPLARLPSCEAEHGCPLHPCGALALSGRPTLSRLPSPPAVAGQSVAFPCLSRCLPVLGLPAALVGLVMTRKRLVAQKEQRWQHRIPVRPDSAVLSSTVVSLDAHSKCSVRNVWPQHGGRGAGSEHLYETYTVRWLRYISQGIIY